MRLMHGEGHYDDTDFRPSRLLDRVRGIRGTHADPGENVPVCLEPSLEAARILRVRG